MNKSFIAVLALVVIILLVVLGCAGKVPDVDWTTAKTKACVMQVNSQGRIPTTLTDPLVIPVDASMAQLLELVERANRDRATLKELTE